MAQEVRVKYAFQIARMQPKVELIEFGTKKVARPLVKIMQAERAGFCA